MGQHRVPQGYLRAFESAPGLIWMYDKAHRTLKELPIKAVAQGRGYYDKDVERQLAGIEGPAHAALARLTSGAPLSAADREALIYYLAVMMFRGPRKRRKAEGFLPAVLDTTVRRLRADIDRLAATLDPDDPDIARWRADIDRVEVEYRQNPPQSVIDQIRQPWPSERVFQLIARKTWRVLIATTEHTFVTSENPVVYFEGIGLRSPDSEIVFPLSPSIALAGDWQGQPGAFSHHSVNDWMVREVNRRVVGYSERFIFSHKPQPWLATVAHKPQLYLSRIDWSGRLNGLK